MFSVTFSFQCQPIWTLPAEEMIGGGVGAGGPEVVEEDVAVVALSCHVQVREHGRRQEDLSILNIHLTNTFFIKKLSKHLFIGSAVLPEGQRRLHRDHVHHGDVAEGELCGGKLRAISTLDKKITLKSGLP